MALKRIPRKLKKGFKESFKYIFIHVSMDRLGESCSRRKATNMLKLVWMEIDRVKLYFGPKHMLWKAKQ